VSIFNTIFSGTQVGNDFPYLQFEQVNCELNHLNTCTERFEDYIFKFCLYHNNASELIKYNDIFRKGMDKQQLVINNRTNTAFQFEDSVFVERELGVYEYSNFYSVQTQKLFSNFVRGTIIGNTLYEALYKRYLDTNLKNRVTDFSTSRFGGSTWERPFIFIPEYKTKEDLITTCDINDLTEFSISFETNNPARDYSILDAIDETYSYSSISIPSSNAKINTQFNWVGNEFEEIDIHLWRGSVMYELSIQRAI